MVKSQKVNLKIHIPFEPFNITQTWGEHNTAYEQFGFTRHNGLDCRPTPGIAKFPIYCPVEGFKVHLTRYTPNGGGNECYLISKDKLQIGDKECHAMLAFFHGEKIFVKAGDDVSLGELFMVGDNTGFSTGPHLHLGLYRVDYNGAQVTYLDTNVDANRSHDPIPYLDWTSAQDLAEFGPFVKSIIRYAQWWSTK